MQGTKARRSELTFSIIEETWASGCDGSFIRALYLASAELEFDVLLPSALFTSERRAAAVTPVIFNGDE